MYFQPCPECFPMIGSQYKLWKGKRSGESEKQLQYRVLEEAYQEATSILNHLPAILIKIINFG